MPVSVQIRVVDYPVLRESNIPVKDTLDALLIDISECGLGLNSPSSLPWGTLVEMQFERSALPLAAANRRGLMRITGRVVHAIPQLDRYRLGVSFIRLDEADRLLIQQLTTTQERRRTPRVSLLQTTAGPD